MSKIEVNKIGPQCGTTLTVGCGAGQTVAVDANTVTIGRCGGTVALASGASQTGFGRTGTVDWQTSIKTSGFTAVSGQGFFVNSGSGAITVGHSTTDKITFDGDLYKTGNALFTAKTGETIDMSLAGITFTLADKTLDFATGTIKLANGVNLTAGTGNGAITIHSIEGTSHEDISL